MTKVLLFSGGMDSFICNFIYDPDILLYIKIGSLYEEKELDAIAKMITDSKYGSNIISKLKIVNMSFLGMYELNNAHIPLRNLLFLEIASYYGDEIMLGALKGETSKDKSKKFRKMTENLLSYCWNDKLGLGTKKKVEIIFPFKKMTKSEIVKEYIKLGGIVEELKYTVSCYDSIYIRCGKCMSCFRRWVAEILNDINIKYTYDPYDYYFRLLSEYNGLLKKVKAIFTKEFWVNLPSNIDVIKALRKYKKMEDK